MYKSRGLTLTLTFLWTAQYVSVLCRDKRRSQVFNSSRCVTQCSCISAAIRPHIFLLGLFVSVLREICAMLFFSLSLNVAFFLMLKRILHEETKLSHDACHVIWNEFYRLT